MLSIHEAGHLLAGGSSVITRERDGWIYHPPHPPANGETILIQAAAGAVAENVVALGQQGAEELLLSNPEQYFNTTHSSDDDKIITLNAPEAVAAVLVKYNVPDVILGGLIQISLKNLKGLDRAMQATPIGGSLKVDVPDVKRRWEEHVTMH